MMTDNQNQYRTLWDQLRRLFNLEVDNARLLVTEKLTVLLSTITFYAILVILVTCITIFLTIGVVNLMLERIEPHWAYLIVAGFYLLVMISLILLRRRFIIDPIARFLSSVILDPTPEPHKNETPS